ncbi:MAG: putative ABC transporter permease subunit [Candidatus Brocadiia bacterium]
MSDVGLLARLRGRMVANTVRSLRRHSLLKMVVVAGAGGAFWLGIFATSFSGFVFIRRFLGDLELLTETLLSLFFLLLGAMLLFSNAIISFGSLFRGEETEFLLACPLASHSVFSYRLIESLTFSSWAFLVLGFPLLLAYGLSVGTDYAAVGPGPLFYEIHPRWWVANLVASGPWLVEHWYYPLVVLAYFVPFVCVPAAVGGLVALVLSRYLPDRVKRVLGLSVVAGVAIALSLVFWAHGAVRSGHVFTEVWMRRVLGRMSFARNVFLPSYWMSQGLVRCARGELAETGYYFLLLASNAAMALLVCWWASGRMLRQAWSRARSHSSLRRRARGQWTSARWAPALRLLVAKDWRLFVRDPVQWSQCAILFGLMGFYVLNLRTFSYHDARPLWKNFTALLNLSATSLVLATVTTRFIFPLLSLEGRRFWLLGLAPVARRTILWAKFVFSFLAALVVTLPLIVLSDYMLKMPPAALGHHAAVTVLICFGVSGLSVGLGAVYPNWREQNPSKIVSGFGGTLNLLLSITFVLAMVVLTAAPYAVHAARLGSGPPAVALSLAAAGGVSLVAGLVPMFAGQRTLARLEF